MIIEIVLAVLIIFAAVFMVLAAVGLLRLPDVPTRMHATTKSSVLATSLIMAAVGLYFLQTDVTARILAIIAFMFITTPVAAHVIGRAAYFSGVPLWSETVKDELGDYYAGRLDKNDTNDD